MGRMEIRENQRISFKTLFPYFEIPDSYRSYFHLLSRHTVYTGFTKHVKLIRHALMLLKISSLFLSSAPVFCELILNGKFLLTPAY